MQRLSCFGVLAHEKSLLQVRSCQRYALVAGAPAFSPPVGREAAHPGRAPRAKAALVNPTFRPPRVIPPKKSSSPANASSPPVSPQTQVSPELLVATLRALGIGDDLLTQIQSSIVTPAPNS